MLDPAKPRLLVMTLLTLVGAALVVTPQALDAQTPGSTGDPARTQQPRAPADEPPAEGEPADEVASDEIVVWGDRLEESLPLELAEYGSRVEVVPSVEIENGSFTDVSQILESSVPGLFVAQKNGPFDYVNASLLGSRTKEILWLVDGIRISNRLYNTTTPLDTLPASMVERVEVLKGGQSLFYGTQSVGGVINVVTRSPSAASGVAVTAGADTNQGTHVDGLLRGGSESQRFVLFASNDEADGYQPFRDEDYQPSSTDRERGYDVTTLGARHRFSIGDQILISSQLQYTDAKLDFATADDRAQSFNERDEIVASVKMDWTPSRRFDVFAKAYWHDWDSTFTRIDNDLANPGGLVTVSDRAVWEFSDYGLNLVGQLDVREDLLFLVGYDRQSYEGRDEEFLIGEQTESVDALFSQARFHLDLLEGARLAAGVRYNAPSDGEDKTVWNLSGEVDVTDRLYTRAQVGTSFRLPSAYELYVIDPCCERGNPDLVAEQSFNVEVGVGGRGRGGSWEVLIFDRSVDDLIGITYDLPAFPDGLVVNTADEVEMFGFELIGRLELDSFVLSADYTRTEAEEKNGSEQIQDIPLDTARLTLEWRPDDLPLGAALSLSHVGDLYDQVSGGIGRVEHGNYEVIDLSAFYAFGSEERHRIGLRVDNVLDEEYDTRISRARRDLDGSSYPAGTLGLPRTLSLRYSFRN